MLRLCLSALLAVAGGWWPYRLSAQTDSTYHLPEVTVQSLRNALPGTYSLHWDSTRLQPFQHQSVADLLAAQSGTYVKSYGLGSLATLSLRGSSASQVAITWNGLPIQSPMLGLTDIALLPVFATDGVNLLHGSGSAQWGSGAIGGTLALNNALPGRGTLAQYQMALGSFGQQSHQIKASFGRPKLAFSTRWMYAKAQNDFTYSLSNGDTRTQQHAAAHQKGHLQSVYWSPNARQQWSAHLWQQFNERQIPPLTTQTISTAQQQDSTLRASIQGRYWLGKHAFYLKTAFFQEKIFYEDALGGVKAPSRFRTGIAELEHKWVIGPHVSAQWGVQQQWFSAMANGYQQPVREARHALFANGIWRSAHVQVQATVRQEWQDGQMIPLMPGLGAQWKPVPILTLKTQWNRHYRLATLNDRYWRPGGNLLLRPEQGWGTEAGFELGSAQRVNYSATAYYRTIKDWILWSVADGQTYWSANNITQVNSYGTEQRLTWQVAPRPKWHFRCQIGHEYVRSVNQIALTKPLLAKGAQLPYTPVHRLFGTAQLGYGAMLLFWQAQWTGAVQGFNEALPAFNTHQVRLAYSPRFRYGQWETFFSVQNIFNRAYQVIERRPMPGRYYSVGLNLSFSFKHVST